MEAIHHDIQQYETIVCGPIQLTFSGVGQSEDVSIISLVNQVSGPVAYGAVFLLPALEASVFAGFVIPGETAVIFGGVLASRGQASLGAMIALAAAGAIIGDSIGYEVGARFGRPLRNSRLGRYVGKDRWQSVEDFVHENSAKAVFFGRFAAILRALIPAVAGFARIPYRRFLFWNAIGGVLWAAAFVLVGYIAGNAFTTVEHTVGRWSIALPGGAILVLVLRHVHNHRNHGNKENGTGSSSSEAKTILVARKR